jgi:hypothetical protein
LLSAVFEDLSFDVSPFAVGPDTRLRFPGIHGDFLPSDQWISGQHLGKVACGFVVLREDDAAAIRPAAVEEKFLEPDKLGVEIEIIFEIFDDFL